MASAEESGNIIIELSDIGENNIKPVHRFHTSLVSQATKTPSGETISALPIMPATAYKGKRMIISFKSAATDTIESEECDWTIPVAFINERTMQLEYIEDKKMEEFTGFTAAGTIDIVCTAGVKTRIATLDAPDGYLITLGAGRKYHAYIGDDTA